VVAASAFQIVFGAFLVAMAVLCVVILTWAIRRDRANWREWRGRRRP
jgi:hypothetical protein